MLTYFHQWRNYRGLSLSQGET